ncbi:O-antigen ligase family protein [Methylobacterium sp. E-045]|uniref:O-antigen ligase family protein n=1 Tax=Methylobacterium sp. E-045 TaxID=2836575 RepID=UPI001FBA18B1|nr:O-antigen ligase [Methylobacterium sp. E-045]MCJ2131655.1 O-antigen ligase family protein [Methylobacterium sp. E-045]
MKTGASGSPSSQTAAAGWHRVRTALAETPAILIARKAAVLAFLLLTWISLRPFQDLSNPDVSELATGREGLTYASFGLLALLCLALTLPTHARALRTFLSPRFLALGAWFALSVVLSQDPATSAKRLTLAGSVMLAAACLPLLARSRNDLRNLLAIASLLLLGACYLGMMLAPDLAIHQANDVVEPMLAGNWRGVFGHKNGAAAVMAMLVFIGIAVARSGLVTAGCAIVILSGLFLIGSEGKSATALLVAALTITGLFTVVRSFPGRVLLTLVPLFAINLFSVGTVVSEPVAALVRLLPVDSTFTGRTDVWQFAIEALGARPLTGYGFSAFWNNVTVRAASDDGSSWAGYASHSHNSYLDTAVTLGLPGLVLVLGIVVVAPLRDVMKIEARGRADPLATMFVQIWLFGLLLSCMESFFFDGGDPVWVTFLVSVFGLHYLARFRSA